MHHYLLPRLAALCTAALLAIAPIAQADTPAAVFGADYVVPGAKVHKIGSLRVAGQVYELRIAVPGEYQANPDRAYPVVYVLDGQWNFTIVTDIVGKLAYDGMMPQAIVAAITWGGEGDDPGQLRARDFTMSQSVQNPIGGGAAAFLSAIEDELIPYVETLYRANDQRVLIGSSLGGLFTSYALLEKPELFDGYIALAAPYSFEASYFESKIAELASSPAASAARLFLGAGSLDFNQDQVKQFAEALGRAKLPGISSHLQIAPGIGHAGVEPIGYTYGLQYAFERPALQLSKQFLRRYEGTYSIAPEAPLLIIKAARGKLIVTEVGGDSFELLASSETSFYVNGVAIELNFTEESDGTLTASLVAQGNVIPLTRQSCETEG